MVVGINRFREHFAGHDHQFVLIGGAASDLLMTDAGLDFRATKDLDIVLIVEALDAAFAERFWAFVEEGGYEVRQQSEGKRVLYRFQKPASRDYPAMLELFSRKPEGLTLADDSHLTPLPIDEEAASLSAILLDNDYYDFLKGMVRIVDAIPVLDEAAIIPFKARAWIDMIARRAEGIRVDDKDIKKHRNDVARLLQLLAADAQYELPATVRTDMTTFANALAEEQDFEPKAFGVAMTRVVVVERLRAAYQL
ncbi:MAG: hypothetical protein J0J06_07260 [Sphingomonas sp.]|uniref:hypothetical protein n=1 Tax=Sphingomonas sp. TaxID=28214 RepID=UPI001ACD6D86|nr:hypothetical protein [Sphingomonas sp.]MBN8815230.1 hypothetical protein [Sphingomonas sp.]